MVERFVGEDLRGARFNRSSLEGAVMRGVEVQGLDIDAPWLAYGALLVNGVDVVPFVEAELDRRFPGRDLRRAEDPDGLRAAWAALERAWAAAVDRVRAMPQGAADVSIDGEWSFAQTVRHLVFATDAWLGRAILRLPRPFHPLGQPHAEYETDGHDMSIFAAGQPALAEVLEVRAQRQAMVRTFLATATEQLLAEPRPTAWSPEHEEPVLHCLHVIFDEEWEHLRFAARDLDAQDDRPPSAGVQPGCQGDPITYHLLMNSRTTAVTAIRGLALGDAFGETWFSRPAEVLEQAMAERWLMDGPWPWTDDTAMALTLLENLDRHGTVDQDALAAEFARAYAADPYRPTARRCTACCARSVAARAGHRSPDASSAGWVRGATARPCGWRRSGCGSATASTRS